MRAALACAGAAVLLAAPVHSEPLAEALAALARYPGESTLRAAIEVTVHRRKDEDAESRTGSVTVWTEHSPHGLRVVYPRALLDRLQAEALAPGDSDSRVPAAEVLGELGAAGLDEALSFAGPLRDLIDGGEVLGSTPAGGGEPARLVVRADPARVRPTPYLKESELLVTLWLAEDGTPVAVLTEQRIKAGRFFINVTSRERTDRELARVGDRLVVTRSEGRMSVSGLGQSFTKAVDTVVRIGEAPAPAKE